MTLYACLTLKRKFKLKLFSKVPVTKNSAGIEGTTAELQRGDILRLIDLFYGMMLPSGNDAALAMA